MRSAESRRLAWLALILLVGAWTLSAGEHAVLRTGFRLRIERHESAGAVTRLFLPGGGVVEVAAADILRFEADEYTPSAPSASRPETGSLEATALQQMVRASGERHGLDPDLIDSVIHAESAGNPRAVSPKGAAGLMQLMPGTARDLNVSDVFDPTQNVDAGTRYLRWLLGLYNNDLTLALAAYNAGPEKVAAHKGVPPYAETRGYVSRVIRSYNRKKTAAGAAR